MKSIVSWIKNLVSFNLITLLYICSSFCQPNDDRQIIQILPFQSEVQSVVDSIESQLSNRINNEIGIDNITAVASKTIDSARSIALVQGAAKVVENNRLQLIVKLSSLKTQNEVTNEIPLNGKSQDDVIDIIIIKLRHFLEQNTSGKLIISSIPLDCSIYLNGIRSGRTPTELTIDKGVHIIQLEGDHLKMFRDTVKINPGQEVRIQKLMEFNGNATRPWIYAASLATLGTIISGIYEYKYHKPYKQFHLPTDPYDNYYKPYRTAYYTRLTFLNISALTWTIAIYQISSNYRLKTRIFGKSEERK